MLSDMISLAELIRSSGLRVVNDGVVDEEELLVSVEFVVVLFDVGSMIGVTDVELMVDVPLVEIRRGFSPSVVVVPVVVAVVVAVVVDAVDAPVVVEQLDWRSL